MNRDPSSKGRGEKTAEEVFHHFHRTKYCTDLKNHSWMPTAEHRKFAEILYEKKYADEYGGPLHEHVLELSLLFMQGIRTKWGRAILPKGDLDDLAPVIGAVRLDGPQKKPAGLFLAQQVIGAFKNDDRNLIKRVKTFSRVTLGDHRNYQIWVAMDRLLSTGNYAPSDRFRQELQQCGIEIECVKFFPTTEEVKNFALAKKEAGIPGFGNLPSKEDPAGWIRLWTESGVGEFLERLPVGRPRKR